MRSCLIVTAVLGCTLRTRFMAGGERRFRFPCPGAVLACQKAPPASAPLPTPPGEATRTGDSVCASRDAAGIPAGLTPLATSRTPQRRLFRGEVIPPPGRSAWLCAPHTGIVLPASRDRPLCKPKIACRADRSWSCYRPVWPYRAGAAVLRTCRCRCSGSRVPRVQDGASELAFGAERLFAEEAVGGKVVDDAKAQRDTAKATLQTALSLQAAVGGTSGVGAPAGVTSRAVYRRLACRPLSGRVREYEVAARQLVLTRALRWLRLSMMKWRGFACLFRRKEFVSARLQRSVCRGALCIACSIGGGGSPCGACPVTAMPQQSTVDRYFVLPKPTRFEVGLTVAVWLTQGEEAESPIIAANALLYDAAGGTWVYQQAAPHSFCDAESK